MTITTDIGNVEFEATPNGTATNAYTTAYSVWLVETRMQNIRMNCYNSYIGEKMEIMHTYLSMGAPVIRLGQHPVKPVISW